jgi:hypothetical protein
LTPTQHFVKGIRAGVGTLAVAEMWLGTATAVLGATAAATAAAATTERAKKRMADFIVGDSS